MLSKSDACCRVLALGSAPLQPPPSTALGSNSQDAGAATIACKGSGQLMEDEESATGELAHLFRPMLEFRAYYARLALTHQQLNEITVLHAPLEGKGLCHDEAASDISYDRGCILCCVYL